MIYYDNIDRSMKKHEDSYGRKVDTDEMKRIVESTLCHRLVCEEEIIAQLWQQESISVDVKEENYGLTQAEIDKGYSALAIESAYFSTFTDNNEKEYTVRRAGFNRVYAILRYDYMEKVVTNLEYQQRASRCDRLEVNDVLEKAWDIIGMHYLEQEEEILKTLSIGEEVYMLESYLDEKQIAVNTTTRQYIIYLITDEDDRIADVSVSKVN